MKKNLRKSEPILGSDTNSVANRPMENPTISVVIPAKNEALNLPSVLADLPDGLLEVILVDGRSTDDTVAVARAHRPDIKVIGQSRKGKGNALACGFAACSGDIIVMIDADGSTDPREIPRFVAALTDGADFAKGSRFMQGGGSSDISRIRRLGNLGLNTLVNVLYKTKFTDLCYGYNAFRRECLPIIDLDPSHLPGVGATEMVWGDGFEVETLINIRVAKSGVRVAEVPSYELDRISGESNLHAVSDGLRVLKTIQLERKRATTLHLVVSNTDVAAESEVVGVPRAPVTHPAAVSPVAHPARAMAPMMAMADGSDAELVEQAG